MSQSFPFLILLAIATLAAAPPAKVENNPDEWSSVSKFPDDKLGNLRIEEIVEPSAEYHYAGFGKADPFRKPPLAELPTDDAIANKGDSRAIAGAEIPIVNSLQRYPLDQLKATGIWLLSDGSKKAMIMTPSAEGVIVKIGDPIAAGKVMDIKRDRVIVRQYSIRRDGAREYQDNDLFLGTKAPEKKGFLVLKPGKPPEFPDENKPASQDTANAPAQPVGSDAPQAGGATPPGVNSPASPVSSPAPAPGSLPAPGTNQAPAQVSLQISAPAPSSTAAPGLAPVPNPPPNNTSTTGPVSQ